MSRIWKNPIAIPQGVEISIKEWIVSVKWPKWTLTFQTAEGVIIEKNDSSLTVTVDSPERANLWGMSRTIISNLVEGVTKWYQKKLMVFWVWYSAKVQWTKLILNLGYSHPIEYPLPAGIAAVVEKDPKWTDVVTVSWIDKQLVGQTAAKIKTFRLPEPYKGKGVRYADEFIKLKPWKAAKK